MDFTTHRLPEDRPRYLMGVGRPQDILDAIATGIDLFDCVLPTRNGRNATCLTAKGNVKLRNAGAPPRPPADRGRVRLPGLPRFSRSYLRHLFIANEMLGPILASIHNLIVPPAAHSPGSRGDRLGRADSSQFRVGSA